MSDLNKKNINYGALNRFYQDLKSHDLSDLNDKIDNIDTLPTASSNTKGGVKVGAGLSISNEVLSTLVTPEVLIKLLLNQDLLSPLTFEATEDNTEITFKGSDINIETSKDGKNWTQYSASTGGTLVGTLNTGEQLFVRGENSCYNGRTFLFDKDTYVYGNIMSLINKNNYPIIYNLTGNNTFRELFKDNTHLLSHQTKKLYLPATTLVDNCYYYMFNGCSGLTTAPELPATTLALSCYYGMFYYCTSLTTAPELPATTLTENCYAHMFEGCSSLTTAPVLPATTLADSCYRSMFQNCTSLTTAPSILPATTSTSYCYNSMFRGCTSLTTAPELPATTLAYSCYAHMFEGCSSLITAPELPATTLTEDCYWSMFNNCTSLTTAPSELPATGSVPPSAYNGMFYNTRITTSPIIRATIMTSEGCCCNMFKRCYNLTTITCLATNVSSSNGTPSWVRYITGNGTFYKNPNMSSWTTGENGIPSGWTVVDYVESNAE